MVTNKVKYTPGDIVHISHHADSWTGLGVVAEGFLMTDETVCVWSYSKGAVGGFHPSCLRLATDREILAWRLTK